MFVDTITRRNTANTFLKQIAFVLGLYVAAGGRERSALCLQK